jgi:ethylbenzene dioxygenase beta subunit
MSTKESTKVAGDVGSSPVQSGVGAPADEPLHALVHRWLILEAELLDDRREREWLERMVSKTIVYQVPVRITVERARGTGFCADTFHLDERYGSLSSRIRRNECGYAWAEDPPSRCRHFISNIRVGRLADGEIKTRSNVLIYRTRQDHSSPQILSGERQDVLIYEGGELRLARRLVLLDLTSIASHNLSLFF